MRDKIRPAEPIHKASLGEGDESVTVAFYDERAFLIIMRCKVGEREWTVHHRVSSYMLEREPVNLIKRTAMGLVAQYRDQRIDVPLDWLVTEMVVAVRKRGGVARYLLGKDSSY